MTTMPSKRLSENGASILSSSAVKEKIATSHNPDFVMKIWLKVAVMEENLSKKRRRKRERGPYNPANHKEKHQIVWRTKEWNPKF